MKRAIAALRKHVPNPSRGLPDDVFYYISATTPMVNVDLLVKDEKGRSLLSWRDDPLAGRGWHLPGGVIRFKETIATRIRKVAAAEIGAAVDFDPVPISVHEIIVPRRAVRGHFISILHGCRLAGSFIPKNKGLSRKDAGYLMWHESCPDDLLTFHEIYRKHLG